MKQANTTSEELDEILAKHGAEAGELTASLKDALLAWKQQELERAVVKAYRKGYQAGWSTGDSGGRTTKRAEVKAKREAWISKKMKEGQS